MFSGEESVRHQRESKCVTGWVANSSIFDSNKRIEPACTAMINEKLMEVLLVPSRPLICIYSYHKSKDAACYGYDSQE